MAKTRTVFLCQSCGYSTGKWLGKCPECSEWNTFVEEVVARATKGGGGLRVVSANSSEPTPITEIRDKTEKRTSTGIGELDRVLGGGLVRGAAVLVGGDPGIGKSTLMLQASMAMADEGMSVLYVSGEESVGQIRLRAERLGEMPEGLLVWSETSVENIEAKATVLKPDIMVIDSVQTIFSEMLESSPGSVGQVREISAKLTSFAKTAGVPVFLVGHVTKDGAIAGPRVLEHMVDTVLYFEGGPSNFYRILRAVKNRFGSVMEIGVFEMKSSGLTEVLNPSEVFLQDRPTGVSGSCVAVSMEGTRPLLVEIQALVSPTVFGVPRRTVVGADFNKVLLIAAVLEKKASVTLTNHDIFIKVAGGMRINEPATDLATALALASNFRDKAIDGATVIIGELGLAGEVRSVVMAEQRVMEAKKLGFKRCILPKDNALGLKRIKGVELIGVATLREALDVVLGESSVKG